MHATVLHRNVMERNHFEDQGADGKVILKWLGRDIERMWIEWSVSEWSPTVDFCGYGDKEFIS